MENCGADHSASPLYAQVADVMRERIVKGTWPIDSRIPTLPALAGEFGVASITVRQAVQLLKNEGLLSPEQGQGTFVRRKPETHPRMKVESSLTRLAELYRELAPRLIPLAEGRATPCLEPEDGMPAPGYRFLRPVHASERQFTSVISAYLDERTLRVGAETIPQRVDHPGADGPRGRAHWGCPADSHHLDGRRRDCERAQYLDERACRRGAARGLLTGRDGDLPGRVDLPWRLHPGRIGPARPEGCAQGLDAGSAPTIVLPTWRVLPQTEGALDERAGGGAVVQNRGSPSFSEPEP